MILTLIRNIEVTVMMWISIWGDGFILAVVLSGIVAAAVTLWYCIESVKRYQTEDDIR
jgi:hypothetical protein